MHISPTLYWLSTDQNSTIGRKKLDECVTLYMYSNFLEMSYELNIKMKRLAPLHLGDVNNLLIPPRIQLALFRIFGDLKESGGKVWY